MSFSIIFHSKWADFDANKHMRHSAYNDYAAECRVRFFMAHNFSVDRFEKENFGPVLFKEETSFLREIKLGEDIKVELFLEGVSKLGERFKLYHRIFKENGVLAAEIKVFGAWIDLEKRKLTKPPLELLSVIDALEKTENYENIFMKS